MRWFILLGLALSFASPALADDVASARALYEEGTTLAEEGRWRDALARFEQSSKLRPHATTFYNLGYCERALGHSIRARKHFTSALERDVAQGGAELTPELRAGSQKYRDEMAALIARATITIEEPGTVVTIDGAPIERSGDHWLAGTMAFGPGAPSPASPFAVEVDAGAHEIVVTASDGRSKITHEYFAPGANKSVRVILPPAIVIRPTTDTGTRKIWGYVVGGVGVVGLGIGTYFGLSARSKWSSAKDLCPSRLACSEDAVSLSSSAHSRGNVATIAFVAGGAALLGGALLVVTSSRSTTVDAGAAPGAAWISFRGSF